MNVPNQVVSVEWLQEHINHKGLIILDATIKSVLAPVDESKPFKAIPNAKFFDIKTAFSDTSADFPNTIPSSAQFEQSAKDLGINTDSIIVVYDCKGIYSSPRAWWLFKTFGHEKVYVLNGGLPEWTAKVFDTKAAYTDSNSKGNFEASYKEENVVFLEHILQLQEDNTHCVLDARSEERFNAEVNEPRKGLRSGHIPNSNNLAFTTILQNGKLKPVEDLKAIYKPLVNGKDITFTCGSGITACVLALGAAEAGYEHFSIYDGSWTEYGTLVKG